MGSRDSRQVVSMNPLPLKIACFGDLHLEEKSLRYAHALEVLDSCIDIAIAKHAVTVFVFCGDIFEGDPTPDEYHAFLQRLYRLLERGRVLIIRGNHESYDAYKFFELLSPMITVAWDDFRTVDLGVARVLLIPYPVRYRPPFHTVDQDTISGSMRASVSIIADKIAEEAYHIKSAGVNKLLVFGHFTVEGMTTRDTDFERHSPNEVVVPFEALAPAAMVKVGHIHRAQQLTRKVGSVGDLYRCSFAEADDRKIFSVITVGNDSSFLDEEIETPCRFMREFALELDQIPVVLEEIEAAAVAGNEIKVVVSMDSTEITRYDQTVFDKVRATAPVFVLEKDVRPVQRVRAPELRADMNLAEEFFAWVHATGTEIPVGRLPNIGEKLGQLT
jgi:DNA repair exonuclease SbcCD nuclease subunit